MSRAWRWVHTESTWARGTVEVEGERVELTQKEFDLFAHLATVSGRVSSREELMSDVWAKSSGEERPDARILDTFMYRLRTKLEKDPAHPKWIVTVQGVGYLLNESLGPRQSTQRP